MQPDYTVTGHRTHQRLNPEDLWCVNCGAIMGPGECYGRNHRVYWEWWFVEIADVAQALSLIKELREEEEQHVKEKWADARAMGII
jgi:hypothetical protein